MRAGYVHIAVVLDRSGSMDEVQDDTIGGFNRFLDEQKKGPGEATFTLVQFDHEYQIVTNFALIACVPPLTRQTFVPRGNTALLNAIGRTIRETGYRLAAMPESDRPSKVLFVIVTDGHENASHEERNPAYRFTKSQINEMISLQRKEYSWEFVFLGANQNAIEEGASIGIPYHTSMTYANNVAGTAHAYASVSANTTRLRCANVAGEQDAQYAFTAEDRQQQIADAQQPPKKAEQP